MHKIISIKYLCLVALCVVCGCVSLNAQYFQATMTNEGSMLVVKIKPTGGNITTSFANMEFFVRYLDSKNLTWDNPIINITDFQGISIQKNDPYTTIPDAGYKIVRFFLPPGTFTTSKTYTNNTEYEVFRTTVTGLGSTNLEMIHRDDYTPYYLAIDNETGDVTGAQKFYGAGVISGVGFQALSLDIVLPVELLEFEGKAEKKANILDWTTAKEENASHFVLEKAVGQPQKFVGIGERKANNVSTNTPQYYTFTDAQPSQLDYYRLKMVDKNGQFSYSKTISLARSERIKVDIFPNPAAHFVNINVTSEGTKNINIDLFDLSGKLIARQANDKQGLDKNTFVFDMNDIPNGVYTAAVTIDGKQSFHKFAVTK